MQELEIWQYINWNNNDLYVDLLLKNPDKINYNVIYSNSSNEKMLEYVLKDFEKINWNYLIINSNDLAVSLTLNNQDKIER